MRIASVRVENYRCLKGVQIDFDDLTVIVGANGSGKSTLLRALGWFFNGGNLDDDDLYRHQTDVVVRVSVVFSDFTSADRAALGSYAAGETATLTRTWSADAGEKLTGRALTFPEFDAIRAIEGAVERRGRYNIFVDAHPEHGLEKAANRDQLDEFMQRFEQAHPKLLQLTDADATHLFGFVGGAKLNGRFSYVFVPAVSDAQAQLTGARGSLLSRLVERLPSGEGDVATRLEELKGDAQRRADELMREQHGEGLKELGERITEAVREFVPDAEVTVDVNPPEVRVTEALFDVHVADDGVPTDVAHQGHGFQRALLLAVLNELARAEGEGDVPAVFLAIEEPELYQHPLQARHFAKVLADLPRQGEGAFQVAYATHSQFFVDAGRYERLRRFGRQRVQGDRTVTAASTAAVADKVQRLVSPERIPQRIKLTLDRQVAEAVFADIVVLVEGKTDAGLISGIADRTGGFEAEGIAVVNVEGKSKIPLAAAVLGELGIPVYVVFDGDRRQEERLRQAAGQDEDRLEKLPATLRNTIALNRTLLAFLEAEEDDWPGTQVTDNYAVFADTIEAEWPEAIAEAARLAEEASDDPKREEWYREAARTLEGAPPPVLERVVAAIRNLR